MTDINVETLKKYNIRAVLLDIDNTLSPHGATVPYDGVSNWINKVQKAGIKIAIISNNKEKRVRLFAENLKIIYYIFDAKKPLKSGLKKASDLLKTDKENILVIGDQIFTDVLGANLFGMKSALVEPKDKKEPFSIKIKRILEILFRFLAKMKCKRGEFC